MIWSVLNTLALSLCGLFLVYVTSILIPFLRRKDGNRGNPADFDWHVMIPCLNEATVIAATLQRLRTDYPQLHVWCIDDASDDDTRAIITAASAADPHIHLVARDFPDARTGKGHALNAAWRQINTYVDAAEVDPERVLVCVLDADARLDPDALAKVAGESGFADPEVGAVQIQVRMINQGGDRIDNDSPAAPTRFGRLLVSLQDLEFRTVIAAMQHTRHKMSSAGMGGNGQFSRLTVLNQVASDAETPWHSALLEDFEFGLHVLLSGAKARYVHEAWVAQEALPDFGRLVRQRTRWAQGGMQCIKYLLKVATSPKLSTASAIEISYFLTVPWTQILGTVVSVATSVVVAALALGSPGGVTGWLSAGAWQVFPLVFAFGVAPIAVWGVVYKLKCEPSISWGRAAVLALSHWLYSYAMLVAAWQAFGRFVRGQSEWSKTARVAAGSGRADTVPTAAQVLELAA